MEKVTLLRLCLFITKWVNKKSWFIYYMNGHSLNSQMGRSTRCRSALETSGGGLAHVRRRTGAWTAPGRRGSVRHQGGVRRRSGGRPATVRRRERTWCAPGKKRTASAFFFPTSGGGQAQLRQPSGTWGAAGASLERGGAAADWFGIFLF